MEDNEIPSGADMAADFEKQESGEVTPDASQGEQSYGESVPTVPDSQEVTPSAPAPVDHSAQERTQYLNLIGQLQEQVRQQREEQEAYRRSNMPKPTAEAPLSIEQLDAIWKQDPMKAMQLAALASPQVKSMQETIAQFKQAEEQRAEQAFANKINSQEAQLAQKYPDFKQGTPVWNAALKYVQSNNQWLRAVAVSNPGFNVVEHAYRQVAFDILRAQSGAQAQRLVDKRAKAGSVKPGGTGAVTPASGSIARDAASELSQSGDSVPEAWVKAAEAGLARHMS